MTDWLLLGGTVALNDMGQRSFWRLLLVTPVTLTAISLLIPWRIPERRVRLLLVGLYGLLWANFLLSHLSAAPQPVAGELGSVVKGALEYVIFPFYFAKYRDWRTWFLILTLGAISAQASASAAILVGRCGVEAVIDLVTCLIFALILAYFVRFQRTSIWMCMEYQSGGWSKFCSIPGLILCVIHLFRAYPDPLTVTVQNPVGVVVVIIMQPVLYRVMFDALNAQRKQAQLEQNAAVLQTQVLMMEEQSRQMERRSREEAVARHDRRHFQQIVLAHLSVGDVQGAQTVIREQMSRSQRADARYCEDPVLNQLIAHYAKWAAEEETDFRARVCLPGGISDRRTELMVAMCNTLENAIHACAQVPGPVRRKIAVTLSTKGRQTYLEVSNTYAGDLRLDPDTGLPHTSQPGHGYGLQSVAALAAQPPVCAAEDGVFTIWMLI